MASRPPDAMARARVRDWMSRRPATVRPQARWSEAARRMRARGIRHLPVVDARGRLAGIITAHDLRQAMFAPAVQARPETLRELLDDLSVGDTMMRRVITIAPGASIGDAARLMHERRVGALPVVERGRLVGVLTETDVLEAFRALLRTRRPARR